MTDERERLARNINDGVETVSSCGGCYLGLLLLLASPLVLVATWGLIGSATNNDWIALVGAGIVAVWLLVTVARLMGWGR